mmetsp:Transcript_43122/g.97159  ORF Transcript_43122/g.97159 Transcript_43122/m.97159 type:complete len:212 (-) Transcript_43122:173-808(-)
MARQAAAGALPGRALLHKICARVPQPVAGLCTQGEVVGKRLVVVEYQHRPVGRPKAQRVQGQHAHQLPAQAARAGAGPRDSNRMAHDSNRKARQQAHGGYLTHTVRRPMARARLASSKGYLPQLAEPQPGPSHQHHGQGPAHEADHANPPEPRRGKPGSDVRSHQQGHPPAAEVRHRCRPAHTGLPFPGQHNHTLIHQAPEQQGAGQREVN